jgi:hypothetical protein
MNNLDDFIQAHRDRFDAQVPPDTVWQRLEARLPKAPVDAPVSRLVAATETVVRPLNSRAGQSFFADTRHRWWLAASVTGLLLLVGFWAVNHQYGLTQQPEIVAVDPGSAKTFVQYARLIDNKRDELRQMTEANPVLYQQFAADLDKLNIGYQSLKADLPQNPNQELLIQAMIQNLNLQIDLLNQQLRVIQQMRRQTSPRHENVL